MIYSWNWGIISLSFCQRVNDIKVLIARAWNYFWFHSSPFDFPYQSSLFHMIAQTIATYQHIYRNIVDPVFADSGETIATFQHSISQHCWAQHVAFGHHVTTFCDMLGIENLTSAHAPVQHCCTNKAKRLQHHAASTNVGWKIWPFSNFSQHYSTCLNMSQHIATGWPNANNMLRPTMLQYVAFKCCNRLAGA